jgi:hypothetical protein
VFGNARGVLPIPDTRFADLTYAGIKAEIDREANVEVTRVKIPDAEFARLARSFQASYNRHTGRVLSGLDKELRELARSCACDTLLVVATTSQSEVLGTNQMARGVSLVRRAGGAPQLLVPMALATVSPATGNVVSWSWAALLSPRLELALPDDPSTIRELPEGSWDTIGTALEATYTIGRQTRLGHGGLARALYAIGLRPSCGLPIYEADVPPPQRDWNSPSYVPQPSLPPGTDSARCR